MNAITSSPETTRPASSRRAPARRRRLAPRAITEVAKLALVLGVLSGTLLLSLGTAWAFPPFDDCKSPPVPAAPDAGLAGTFDPNILMAGGGNSRYSTYGYGGLKWATFDLGCGGAIRDPGAASDTLFGNFFLSIAVDSLALYSGLHQLTAPEHAQPGPLSPIDPAPISAAASSTSTALYGVLFSPWAGVALALAAMATLLAARRGDAGAVLNRGALMIVALAVSALSFGGGAQLSTALRESVTGALDSASQALGEQMDFDPVRGPRDMIFNGLLWPAWRAGEVGSHGSEELANQLYINQSISVAEQLSAGKDTQKLLTDKGNAWKQVAAGAQSSDVIAYTNIQGRGDSRTATGLLALLQVAPLCWFQILTEFLQLCLLIFLTLSPVAAPLLGLVSLVLPDTLEKAVKTIGAVIVGGVVASVAGLVQIALATKLVGQQGIDQAHTGAGSPSWVVTLVILGITIVLLALVRPFMSIRAILISSASRPSRRMLNTTQRVVLASHYLTNRSYGGSRRSGDKDTSRPDTDQPKGKGGGPADDSNPSAGGGPKSGKAPRAQSGRNRTGTGPVAGGGAGSGSRFVGAGQSGAGGGQEGATRGPGRVAGRGARTGGIDPTGPSSRTTRTTTASSTRLQGRVDVAADPVGRRVSSAASAQATVASSAVVFRPRPRPYVRPTVTPEFREPRPTEPPRREPQPRPRPS
ncbi:hypothetical protein [Pseudonocardia spinosispora]|uniref:hypothetical protein n=1 Tax=Pseudonocardia spinosispora TaxID=103441 RepID=UPI00040C1DC9|nr:hypothetical protein [Pseudonocardia spinosispora]